MANLAPRIPAYQAIEAGLKTPKFIESRHAYLEVRTVEEKGVTAFRVCGCGLGAMLLGAGWSVQEWINHRTRILSSGYANDAYESPLETISEALGIPLEMVAYINKQHLNRVATAQEIADEFREKTPELGVKVKT